MYILDALWRGEITPNERYTKPDSQYCCLAAKAHEAYVKFRSELTEAGKQYYDEFEKIQNEMNSLSEEEVFIEAFRMGARMILDVIGDYEPRYQQKTAGK